MTKHYLFFILFLFSALTISAQTEITPSDNPITLSHGETYKITGTDATYFCLPDFFSKNDDGTYTFNAMTGEYIVTTGIDTDKETHKTQNFIKVVYPDSKVWINSTTTSVDLPSYRSYHEWADENAICLAPISDNKYTITFAVGKDLSTYANFKFFTKSTSNSDAYTFTTIESDGMFKQWPQTEDNALNYRALNIMNDTKELKPGQLIKLTVDISGGKDNSTLTAELVKNTEGKVYIGEGSEISLADALAQQCDITDPLTVESLSIDGQMDTQDVKLLRQMAGGLENEVGLDIKDTDGRQGALKVLNLANAFFVSDGTSFLTYKQDENKTYTYYVENNNNKLSNHLFFKCKNLTTVTLPNLVNTLSDQTFDHCTSLTTVNGIEHITSYDSGIYTFCNTALTTFEMPDNVDDIPVGFLKDCPNLTTVVLNGDETSIGEQAFFGCNKLNKVYVKGTIANDGDIILPNTIIKIDDGAFEWGFAIKNVQLPENKDFTLIDKNTFAYCNNLETLNIPSNVTNIGTNAFVIGSQQTSSLKTINVHGATAPACDTSNNHDPFNGTDGNNVSVVFQDDANKNNSYVSYQTEATWQRLLTKTLDETAETYNVAAQMHGIVKLNRTFKAGWNTLVLPFAAATDHRVDTDNNETDGARIFQKALNASNNEDFMIAAYRGYNEQAQSFRFLKYNDYDTWKVDAFEPMLIYMVQTDVDNATTGSKQTWTFNNVDVNYEYLEDKDHNRQYNKQDNPSIKAWAGDVDQTLNGFKGNNYTLYTFTGTYVTSYNIMGENDYYIRDNKFYKFEGSNRYASRGFRGWFHYNGNANTAKNKVNIDIVNGDSGEVTKITTADINTNTDNTVYDIAGRKIANTKNLSRGIYIVNGKKIIVK